MTKNESKQKIRLKIKWHDCEKYGPCPHNKYTNIKNSEVFLCSLENIVIFSS
jgi:hypothetical protein